MGAVDFLKCPFPAGRCRCGECAVCGFHEHTAIHGPAYGDPPGADPVGHEFIPREPEKQLVDMTEPELRDLFCKLSAGIKGGLPQGTLFVLLAFDGQGVAQYASNANRADMVKALRETADRIEARQEVGRG